jgi:prevent-host-death family protein
MKRTSLAEAKAHLSALVSEAQHRGRRTLILRHGKPSAAIVPVDVALAPKPPATAGMRRRLTAKQVRELLRGLGRGSKRRSAVADLLASRR